MLQTLRCIGHSSGGRLATASGLGDDRAGALLSRLRDRGLASLDDGPFGGWSLTPTGRGVVERLVEEELDAAGARSDVLGAYERFLPLNALVMDVFHDWQMRSLAGTRMLNDHSDPLYDDAVLTRLVEFDVAAQDLVGSLAGGISRFGGYGPRLATALERAREGDFSYVADGMESYHTVWFQLHEDLLTTCGISREEERRRGM